MSLVFPGLPSQEEAVRLAEGSADHEVVVLLGELEVADCEWCGLRKVRQGLAVGLEALLESKANCHDRAGS